METTTTTLRVPCVVVVEAFAKKLRVTTQWLLLWRRKEIEPIPKKCVSKTWRALPTNPIFIASHLEKDTPTRYDFQPVNLTFGFHRKADLVLGPCDGIFCLVWSIGKDGIYGSTEVPTIALWNPATRAFSILPMSICDLPPYGQLHRCLVGFGLDLKTKSYKVVKFSYFGDDDFGVYNNSVEVYDSSSGSWRVLHAYHFFPEVLIHDGPQISTYNKSDGVFHWFALHNYDFCSVSCYEGLVLSFDMSKELFHMTRLPEKFNTFTQELTLFPNVDYIKRKECSLGLIRDSLAVIFSFLEEGRTYIEVWVMKKDFDCMVEVEKSSYRWFHELTVEVPIPGSWAPLGFWNKNELLIRKWRSELDTLILYDIVTKQARNVKISGKQNFLYKESLVSVKGGCGN
ncbi:hypothetical protein RHSIM_Rhsim06G0130000 [Rhododendron simsii]|uniref:F-box associated beta-propeller type 1 domain-containing protein n=1 Tax=Rhododendron simsii TaxID=118357 RepID=A0A834GTQ1_RHOSS|nr:hypothetical protein RHSIM_Rhsim06G0130000 [Rhododendron simsii]